MKQNIMFKSVPVIDNIELAELMGGNNAHRELEEFLCDQYPQGIISEYCLLVHFKYSLDPKYAGSCLNGGKIRYTNKMPSKQMQKNLEKVRKALLKRGIKAPAVMVYLG